MNLKNYHFILSITLVRINILTSSFFLAFSLTKALHLTPTTLYPIVFKLLQLVLYVANISFLSQCSNILYPFTVGRVLVKLKKARRLPSDLFNIITIFAPLILSPISMFFVSNEAPI